MGSQRDAHEGTELETIEDFDTLDKGDTVVVEYRNTRGKMSKKGGKVTDHGGSYVLVDTLEEKDDGTPITFGVQESGYVESLTGDTSRTLTDNLNGAEDTVVKVET